MSGTRRAGNEPAGRGGPPSAMRSWLFVPGDSDHKHEKALDYAPPTP